MARKVFISVLGTGLYEKGYYISGEFRSSKTTFIQQATLEFLHCDKWPADSKAFFLLTDKARQDNWIVANGKRIKQPEKIEIDYTGLHDIIQGMNLPFSCEDISIPDGNNEQEMWNIFSAVFERLEENDELHFDLTHSFRYLPMLMLVLGNYAKFLKRTTICSITYGNWEARNKATSEAPINNLLPLSSLLDWTHATSEYINYGFADNLVSLSLGQLNPLLRNDETRTEDTKLLRDMVNKMKTMSEEIRFCRGVEITNASTIMTLKKKIQQLQKVVVPLLGPVVEKIDESIKGFQSANDITNMFQAAQWCNEHQLFQQATTFMEEGIISFFCKRHNIDIQDHRKRDLINSAFYIKTNNKPEAEWTIADENKPLLKEILSDTLMDNEGFLNGYSTLVDLRNLYNHCGMKKDKKNINFMKEGAEKAIQMHSFLSHAPSSAQEVQHPLFINLSNHPSTVWDEAQVEVAQMQYGNIVDMPFPPISPEASHDEVSRLAEEYVERIMLLAREADVTVHVMGEMTFTYAVVRRLLAMGIACVASTTERIVVEADGKRTYTFRFSRFREY